jgi:hypothetical protein
MASVLEIDGGASDIAKNPRRRGKSWLLDDNVGVVTTVRTVPDSAIDGANLRYATHEKKVYDNYRRRDPSLADVPDQT